jgi:hypothetical protein
MSDTVKYLLDDSGEWRHLAGIAEVYAQTPRLRLGQAAGSMTPMRVW